VRGRGSSLDFPSREDLLRDETGDLGAGAGPLAVALAYPNAYGVAMASLGFQAVRALLRAHPAVRVERALAWPAAPGRNPVAPSGRTLESDRGLAEFDLVAFSVAYELDYLNLLQMLRAAGLPLRAAERRAGAWPLVLVGGPAVAVNAAPIAPYADVLMAGRAEESLPALLDACAAHPRLRSDPEERARLVEALRRLPGLALGDAWAENEGERSGLSGQSGRSGQSGLSGHSGPIEPSGPDDTSSQSDTGLCPPSPQCPLSPLGPPSPHGPPGPPPLPHASRIVTPRAEFGRRVLVEISRGCAHRCAFCWIGHHAGRFAPWPADAVLAACDIARALTRCDSVGLISSAVGAHPEIGRICEGLLARGCSLSFSSLRAEDVTPAMLEALVRSGQRGLTLAPETADPELRRALGKPLDDAGYFAAIERAQAAGLEDLKLYFMIGLPGETEEAADRVVPFCDAARRILLAHGRPRGHIGTLAVNLEIYVPKPGTPLAGRERPDRAAVRRRTARLTRALGALPNVRVAAPSADLAHVQEILSNGREDAVALLEAALAAGGNWRAALQALKRARPSGREDPAPV
jgi:radical SAM superfamily enzyme YgiQ (UPF0313 family)